MATVPNPILIDAHVHVHDPVSAGALFEAACTNFAQAAAQLGLPGWSGVLMLAEMRAAAWFEAVVAGEVAAPAGWTLHADPDDELVLHARGRGRALLIVAGRQIATREGVEVLTLATRARLPDGETLDRTLERAAGTGALIVLPWGAGKWTGRRRVLVHEALRRHGPAIKAGDSGGRPAFWSAQQDFAAAGSAPGLVSGTDPLPLPGEERRVGSYGCWLAGPLPAGRPGQWLREQLRGATGSQLRPFGASLGAAGFVRAQLLLRLARGKGSAAAAPEPIDTSGNHPDLETSSASYARRFAGPAGRYLLDVQSKAILEALRGLPPGRALDVGGGHGQVVPLLRELGWQVTVHGTDPGCLRNLRELHGRHDCEFVQGDLFHLPAADRSFDLVIAVRLMAHVEEWQKLLAEMCRVAARAVVIDYPVRGGQNASTGRFFGLKKAVEGNTRTYISFSHQQIEQALQAQQFGSPRRVKQFILPMVAHRLGKGSAPLRLVESLSRALGITALAGSPVILRMDRQS